MTTVTSTTSAARQVHTRLARHMLTDGFDFVLDLERSQGSRLVDERDGSTYLDMFSFFASSALGMNYPALSGDPEFLARLTQAAINKPSNSDVYTVELARFVDTFARVVGDPRLPHLFFIEGGTLAVENALKAAFDWKSQHNEAHGRPAELGTQVMHLNGAFHGRSGYTMSLTNTDPVKVARYPKFAWPRIASPHVVAGRDIPRAEAIALDQAAQAFAAHPHDIACFIAEPIQGEGGDRHFRPGFLQAMQQLCSDNDALFIVDEVQTGLGLTGTAWAYQQLGLTPDIVAFGKKAQVCGIMAGGRLDEVPSNVFAVSSRLNSTWGGNLTDMVRAQRILEVIEQEQLIEQAARRGQHLLEQLTKLAAQYPRVSDPRGRGLMCAITLPTTDERDEILTRLRTQERVLILGTGQDGIRFRPALTVSEAELDEAVTALGRVLAAMS